MKKTKITRTKFTAFMVLGISMLAACAQSETETSHIENSSDTSTQESVKPSQATGKEARVIPSEVSAQSDLLTVQAEVNVAEGVDLNAVPIGTAEVHLLDIDQIYEDLSYGVAVEEKIEYENENGNEDIDSFTSRTFYYKDGRILIIEPLYLSYLTPKLDFINGKVMWEEEGLDLYNMEVYRDKELSFAESEAVYREMKSRLEQWGILLGEDYELFGLDHETMKEQEYVMNDQGEYDASLKKESWSEEDDCYYFRCAQEFHKIPIYYYGYGLLRGYHNIGSAFKIKYDKDGFVEITIERPYDIQDTGTTVSIIPAEEAVDCLIRKFNNIIMTDPVVVDQLSLQMLPQRTSAGHYDLVPVWIFEGDEYWTFDDGTQKTVGDKYMFDAQTGKEIIL